MLDDRLLEVINKKSSNFLVTGPPGSGKTHLLVELARYLIISKKVEPSKILIFSFNRRWSKFIREKTASLIGRTIMEIPVETFYSFSTDFINKANVLIHSKYFSGASTRTDRKNTARIGDIKILNSTRQWKLLKKVIWSLVKKNYQHTTRRLKSCFNLQPRSRFCNRPHSTSGFGMIMVWDTVIHLFFMWALIGRSANGINGLLQRLLQV